jgi:glycerol transport system ATP-binding protein
MSLELRAVSKRVGAETHIHETRLTLAPEGFNVLLGATGAGKTTLIKLMAGLETPTAGEVWFRGRNVTGVIPRKRNVSLVHQFFINYPTMTVYDNIASPLRVAGVARPEIDRRVRETAEILHLTPMLDRRPQQLSGGQQQRTALARAIVKASDLVLLDEPLANLDYKLREELRVEIPRIFEASGAIFVYATTEPEEALLLGGNTATLWEGRVTQYGPTPRVYRQPQDATTARVFSDPPMNFVPCRKRGDRLTLGTSTAVPAIGPLAAIPDGSYRAGFRANHLDFQRRGPNAVSFDATLATSEITGSETFFHVRHGDDAWVGLVEGVHPLEPGPITVWLDPAHVYLFAEDGRLAAPAPYAMAA